MGSAWTWIVANAQWLFSGVGVLALTISFVILREGVKRWRESRADVGDGQDHVSHAQIARRPLQSRLPGVLLRVLYKPDDIQQHVVIGLRDNAPGSLNLGNPIPSVDLYFQITNLSPIDLVLDRALVDVWFSQPTFTVALLHRYRVPASEITKGIHVRHMLTGSQKAYIQAFETAPRGTLGRFQVYITAYFESKLGRVAVQSTVDRDKF